MIWVVEALRSNLEQADHEMLEPVFRLGQNDPGDNMLYRIGRCFNHFLGIDEECCELAWNLLALNIYAHTIVDDILDFTELRLGIPTAHRVYGNQKTCCAVNLALNVSLINISRLNSVDMVDRYIKYFNMSYAGQGVEIYMRELGVCPTEEEFLQFIAKKFRASFLGILDIQQYFSENKTDFTPLTDCLGLFEILYNDYTNLYTKSYFTSKGYGEDITNGTFNYVIIHAVHSNPQNTEILDIVKQKTKDVKLIKHCIDLIEKQGSFTYAAGRLQKLEQKILKMVEQYGGNPILEEIIRQVMETLGTQAFVV